MKSSTYYTEKFKAIDDRFPNAKFTVSCFDSIDEIENKVLTDDDVIIYQDCYLDEGKKLNDSFIINKRNDKKHIYYCDVIDELIRNDFVRNDCDHRYLENIREFNIDKRNGNSIKTFCSFWGS
jgi:hypothetical protein